MELFNLTPSIPLKMKINLMRLHVFIKGTRIGFLTKRNYSNFYYWVVWQTGNSVIFAKIYMPHELT